MQRYRGVAVGVLFAAVAVLIVSPYPHLTYDGVNYLSLGRSLAESGEFRRLGNPQVVYGPLYAVLIAPLFLASAEPFLLLSLLNYGLLVLFAWTAWQWARQVAPEAACLVACFALANVVILNLFRRPLSETLFCGGMYGLAVGYNRVLSGSHRGATWVWLTGVGSAIVLVRQAGLVMPVGMAAALGWQAVRGRRTWRSAAGLSLLCVGPPAIVCAGWYALDHRRGSADFSYSNAHVLATGTREAGMADMPTEPLGRRVAEGLRVRTAEVGRLTVPGLWKSYAAPETWWDVNTAVHSALFILATIGWVRHLRSTDDVLTWAWPGYFALHVYWPFDQSCRYTAPLLPLLVVFLWRAFPGWPDLRRQVFEAAVGLHLAVSVGNWAFAEMPEAYAIWRQRDRFRELGAEFRHRPADLTFARGSRDLRPALEFWLDRPVAGPDRPAAGWVVGWDDPVRRPKYHRELVVWRRPDQP